MSADPQPSPARTLRIRPWVLSGLVVLIVSQIVLLSPAPLEQGAARTVSENAIFQEIDPKPVLAENVPKRVPDYTVEDFNYSSTKNGKKDWKINATRAFVFNKEQIVHSETVIAHLYDAEGKITEIRGKEALYYMDRRHLEVFGDVHAKFPDGFETHSEYMRYLPANRQIYIPEHIRVHGEGQEEKGQKYKFDSIGLDYRMGEAEILLPKEVSMTLSRQVKNEKTGALTNEDTTILSDRAVIDRSKQISHFAMFPIRPLSERFVQIHQPTLYTRSRRADLNYGDYSGTSRLNYLTAYEDVFIKEKGEPEEGATPLLRYATSGRADFDSKTNIIILTDFPQVYQANDTVTGDIVTLHRDTDIVEVEHSNAFSEGQSDDEKQEQRQRESESDDEPGAGKGSEPGPTPGAR